MSESIYIEKNRITAPELSVPFLSGSMHYWRHKPAVWERALQEMKACGLSLVCTYVPWSVHEREKGAFDFGEGDPSKDLPRFLELVKKAGLYCVVRPGPHINAELTYFGYPKRIFNRDELLSKSATDTYVYLPVPFRAFPVPSYASEAFYEEVREYFSALAPIFKSHMVPRGPIVALQCDNEMSLFFRVQPYDHDYSLASQQLYRQFLLEKYGSLEEIRRAHRLEYPAIERVKPPRRYVAEHIRQLRRHLDWVEYKQYYIAYALKKIKAMWQELGVKEPLFFHNYPVPFPQPPYEIASVEEFLDFQGLDTYPTRQQYHLLKKGALFLSTESRFPCFPEFSSGFTAMTPTVTLEDQKFTTPTLFMHGVKGINFYMFVDRDRWYGAPISRRGNKREPLFSFFQKTLEDLKKIGIFDAKREAKVLLVLPRVYHYMELATSLISPIPIEFLELFLDWTPDMWTDEQDLQIPAPPQLYFTRYVEAFYQALTEQHVLFSIASDAVSEDLLKEYQLLILPTFNFFPTPFLKKVCRFVERGGIILTGPGIPEMDENARVKKLLPFALPKPLGMVEEAVLDDLRLERAQIFDVHPRRRILASDEGDTIAFQLKHRKGRIVHLSGVPKQAEETPKAMQAFLKRVLKMASVEKPFDLDNIKLDLNLQKATGYDLLFIANPTDKEQHGVLTFSGKKEFALWGEDQFQKSKGSFPVNISPYTVLAYRVRHVR